MNLRFLTSFHYFRRYDLGLLAEGAGDIPLFVFGDSGAYSAASLGATIDLHEYAEWLIKWSHILTVYSNLDVIGDPDASMLNQRRLETEYNLRPLPVFHVGSNFSRLEALCEEYEYVALGGMVPYSTANLGSWLLRCFRTAEKYGTAFHGFGQTRTQYLLDFPFYSVDSSTWGTGHVYGRLGIWDESLKNFRVCQVGDRPGVYACADLIRSYGFDPETYVNRDLFHRSHAIALTAESWRQFERFLQNRHRSSWRPTLGSGPSVYLADGAGSNLLEAIPRVFLSVSTSDCKSILTASNIREDDQ